MHHGTPLIQNLLAVVSRSAFKCHRSRDNNDQHSQSTRRIHPVQKIGRVWKRWCEFQSISQEFGNPFIRTSRRPSMEAFPDRQRKINKYIPHPNWPVRTDTIDRDVAKDTEFPRPNKSEICVYIRMPTWIYISLGGWIQIHCLMNSSLHALTENKIHFFIYFTCLGIRKTTQIVVPLPIGIHYPETIYFSSTGSRK